MQEEVTPEVATEKKTRKPREKKAEASCKSEFLHMRLTKSERDRLVKCAATMHMNTTTFILYLLTTYEMQNIPKK